MVRRKGSADARRALERALTGTGFDALDGAREVRSRLDVIERQVVSEARAAGMTWRAIGMASGISAQGAEQKWGPGLVLSATSDRVGSNTLSTFRGVDSTFRTVDEDA